MSAYKIIVKRKNTYLWISLGKAWNRTFFPSFSLMAPVRLLQLYAEHSCPFPGIRPHWGDICIGACYDSQSLLFPLTEISPKDIDRWLHQPRRSFTIFTNSSGHRHFKVLCCANRKTLRLFISDLSSVSKENGVNTETTFARP